MRYPFIRDHADEYPIRTMCRVLEVSPSGYYAWSKRPESKRARENRRILTEIKAIFTRFKERYGSPRVLKELRKREIFCDIKRVARLMAQNDLRARQRRKYKATTDSKHDFPVAPNLLDRQFDATAPDQIWLADITYIQTIEGWLYLAFILDMFSRRIVGWSTSTSLSRRLAIDALMMAIWRRRPPVGMIHHSDRGVQYASDDYQAILDAHGVVCSMSRKGDCWDNAPAESFISTLRMEELFGKEKLTREQINALLFDYIEAFYNFERLHSSLGYLSPVEFERMARVA